MPKYNLITVLLMVLTFIACNSGSKKQNKATEHVITKVTPSSNREDVVYQSESLTIRKISSNVYEHTSFLISESFGKVPCNGIVVISKEEAIVFDTPANEESSEELIHYLMKQKALKINAVIATHFHADCVAGLNKFHQYRIPSHANSLTIDLAKSGNSPVPQKGFKKVK
jgi:metallo-beta-lactamase class B